jgi:hypothetical protein
MNKLVGLNIRVTQKIPENVGLRNETQPTLELFFRQNLRSIVSIPKTVIRQYSGFRSSEVQF